MCKYFDRKLNPSCFQGKLRSKHYFEGWYFKLVDKSSSTIYAIIPGVSLDKNGQDHAFIQVINGATSETHYINYKMEDFHFSLKEFWVKIRDNVFGKDGMVLDINNKEISIKGNVQFGEFTPWPVSFLSPGSMGWYAYVPFMECYHGIVSFDHSLQGSLTINGTLHSFDQGRGYIEKDWGRSFPSYYIWIQSNHFKEEGVSIMASLANIPWLGTKFDGYLIGFLWNKKLYRFTTYTGAKIKKLELFSNRVILHEADKRRRIEIDVVIVHEPGELKSPLLGAMNNRIRESLNSIVKVRLIELKGTVENIIYEGESKHTGFEMGGETDKIKQIK